MTATARARAAAAERRAGAGSISFILARECTRLAPDFEGVLDLCLRRRGDAPMTSSRTAAAVFAVLAAWASGAAQPAAAQVVLHQVPGASPGEFFGWGISFAGDVDQ